MIELFDNPSAMILHLFLIFLGFYHHFFYLKEVYTSEHPISDSLMATVHHVEVLYGTGHGDFF
jgi:hypothetical protein